MSENVVYIVGIVLQLLRTESTPLLLNSCYKKIENLKVRLLYPVADTPDASDATKSTDTYCVFLCTKTEFLSVMPVCYFYTKMLGNKVCLVFG
jgi:hypothetical protein